MSESVKEPSATAQTGDPRERWKDIRGLRLPAKWPPKYPDVTPIRLSRGTTLISEQIIRDRR